jgi:hypothetical protein
LVNFYQTTRRYNPEDGHLYLCGSHGNDRKHAINKLHSVIKSPHATTEIETALLLKAFG